MSGSLSNYAENALLDHVLKTTPFSQPTHIYVALSTADPGEDGAGIAEPGSNYARQQCDVWDAAAGGRATENTNEIAFPEAEGDWGTITHFALFDLVSGGNMLAHGQLENSKTINAGIDAKFAAGNIDISINSGGMSNYLASKLLDHLFMNDAYTVPTDIYVALATATIVDADTGTTITEPGSNYARKKCNGWDAAVDGLADNTAAITFVTATGDWSVCIDACLVDALTTGNVLFYMAVDTSRHPDVGDTVQWDIGSFDISLD